VQREVERLVAEEQQVAVALCDRGTVDGVAYWPDPPETFWQDVGSELSAELARAATRLVKIPMAGRLDSLNLAVAAALVLYQIRGPHLRL